MCHLSDVMLSTAYQRWWLKKCECNASPIRTQTCRSWMGNKCQALGEPTRKSHCQQQVGDSQVRQILHNKEVERTIWILFSSFSKQEERVNIISTLPGAFAILIEDVTGNEEQRSEWCVGAFRWDSGSELIGSESTSGVTVIQLTQHHSGHYLDT